MALFRCGGESFTGFKKYALAACRTGGTVVGCYYNNGSGDVQFADNITGSSFSASDLITITQVSGGFTITVKADCHLIIESAVTAERFNNDVAANTSKSVTNSNNDVAIFAYIA